MKKPVIPLSRCSILTMQILLINPPRFDSKLYTLRDEICFQDVKYVPFPIRLAQVGAQLQQSPGCEVKARDANACGLDWDALRREMPYADVVIFQSAAGLIKHDVKVADIAKDKIGREVHTILIESVVSPIYPEQMLDDFPNLDIVLRGQPEVVIPNLIKSLSAPEQAFSRPSLSKVPGIAFRSNGKVVCTEQAKPLPDLDALPFMSYDLFPPTNYSIGYLDAPMHEKVIPGVRMRTPRDCPYGCPFCIIGSSIYRGYDRKWKAMSPSRVVDEIEHVVKRFKVKGFFFWDETFTLDKKRADEICEEIIRRGLNIRWRCLTRIDSVTPDLLKKMSRAGCKLIEYGIEAGDASARANLHKRFTDAQAIETVRETRRSGMKANCDLIVGMPWETKQTLKKTLHFAKKLNADNVHLTMAFPCPGTEFYAVAEREGLLEVNDIYDLMIHQRVRGRAKPIVHTRSISSNELEEAWQEIRRKINRYYLLENVIFRPKNLVNMLRALGQTQSILRSIRSGAQAVRQPRPQRVGKRPIGNAVPIPLRS